MAASNAVTTIIKLSEDVKAGATSLGSQNQEAQVIISFFWQQIYSMIRFVSLLVLPLIGHGEDGIFSALIQDRRLNL